MRCYVGLSSSFPLKIGRKYVHSKKEIIELGNPGTIEKLIDANFLSKIASILLLSHIIEVSNRLFLHGVELQGRKL